MIVNTRRLSLSNDPCILQVLLVVQAFPQFLKMSGTILLTIDSNIQVLQVVLNLFLQTDNRPMCHLLFIDLGFEYL